MMGPNRNKAIVHDTRSPPGVENTTMATTTGTNNQNNNSDSNKKTLDTYMPYIHTYIHTYMTCIHTYDARTHEQIINEEYHHSRCRRGNVKSINK